MTFEHAPVSMSARRVSLLLNLTLTYDKAVCFGSLEIELSSRMFCGCVFGSEGVLRLWVLKGGLFSFLESG